ncbi:MAG: DUF1553 domain-containing protein [Opitutaceae bacterium]|nr:DUF1553 domain-containing protein [Opitutaceae bacterium]
MSPGLMLVSSRAFRLLATIGCAGSAFAALPSAADLEFFEKKIRPLLIERCYECHAAEKKVKAGLRLDHAAGWLQGGDSGPAVLPGKVDESPLIKAIRYTGLEFEEMPPKTQLPRAEIALLEEWVRRGAPAPNEPAPAAVAATAEAGKKSGMTVEEGKSFWSFVPPVNPPVPNVAGTWPRTDIDRFIAAEWGSKGLRPAADAERAALLRRATFDLTGLPPAPEAIEAFVRDARPMPDAFAAVVDGLLASPHFGERWGRRWLDVARFAESSGGGRTLMFKDAWRYRDYVIDAVNRDVPFDRFIREQIAGDLLPAATPEARRRQIAATAFLALGPTNYEEQNKDQLRMDIIDEQLDTMGKAFLGLTIGCARCHDHKFDPIPTRDYHALAGILRSTHTLHNYTDNVARWVDAELPVEAEAELEIAAHAAKVAALEKQIAAVRKVATAARPASLATLPGLVLDDQRAKIVGAWKSSTAVKPFLGEGYLTDNNEEKGQRTITFSPVITQGGLYDVRLAYTAQPNRASNVPVTILHADGESTVTVNQRQAPPLDGHFVRLGQFRFEKDGAGYILVSTEGTDGHVIVDALQLIPAEPATVVLAGTADGPKKAAKKTAAEPADPVARKAAAELRTLEADLKKLVASGPKRPVAMSVREATGEIGDTEIRVRGIARNLGPKVPRGFLQVAMRGESPTFSPTESGRRELADWMASPDNPLTARVAVNRVWAWLMGAGLVRTVDNFGTTGERPSHPALLDHLAQRFVADGWSVKKLVRAIMLSRTYQLASAPAPDAARLDPDNRLFTHAPRRRLEAEEIRDAMLWAAGQLDLTLGGPNIGSGKAAPGAMATSEYGYVFTDTRRSLYTPAFRNTRLELFEVFDFADINAPMAQRAASAVAPQALFLMNHPFVLEQARHAAERTLREPAADAAARIDLAYRRTLGRAPTAGEKQIALRHVADASTEAWTEFHQALFASVDFRYLN